MRVLITGGAGFIGQRTGELLLKQGHQVTILDNLSPPAHDGPPALPAGGLSRKRAQHLERATLAGQALGDLGLKILRDGLKRGHPGLERGHGVRQEALGGGGHGRHHTPRGGMV